MAKTYDFSTFHGAMYNKNFAPTSRNILFEGKDIINIEGDTVSEPIGVGASDQLYVQGNGSAPSYTVEGRLTDASPWTALTLTKLGDRSESTDAVSDGAVYVADVHYLFQIRIANAGTDPVMAKFENFGIK